MRFLGKKKLILVLVLLILSSNSVGFGATLAVVNPIDSLNLNLTGDQHLYPALKGVTLNPQNPFKMEFILDTPGNAIPSKEEVVTVIRYFLAALTLPENDLWVNLSPYEPESIINPGFSVTQMGETLLAQDYLLKQLSAALTFPETEMGKKYWQVVSGVDVNNHSPANNFNKVWITPKAALVRENSHSAYIESASLRALTEVDYGASQKNVQDTINHVSTPSDNTNAFKTYILPQVEEAVNHARAFAPLRQAYSAFVLATWFKQKLKQSIFTSYIDQKKITGIDTVDKRACDKLYQQYLMAFTQGAYNYVKSERVGANNPLGVFGVNHSFVKKIVRRVYFSGGMELDWQHVPTISGGFTITAMPSEAAGKLPQGPRAAVAFTPIDASVAAGEAGAYEYFTLKGHLEPSFELRQAWANCKTIAAKGTKVFSGRVINYKIIYDSDTPGALLPKGLPAYSFGQGNSLTIVLPGDFKDSAKDVLRQEIITRVLCQYYIETVSVKPNPYRLAVSIKVLELVHDYFASRHFDMPTDMIWVKEKITDAIVNHTIANINWREGAFTFYPGLPEYFQARVEDLNNIRDKSAPAYAKWIIRMWASAFTAVEYAKSGGDGLTAIDIEAIHSCPLDLGAELVDSKYEITNQIVDQFLRNSGLFEDPVAAFKTYLTYHEHFREILGTEMRHKFTLTYKSGPGGGFRTYKNIRDRTSLWQFEKGLLQKFKNWARDQMEYDFIKAQNTKVLSAGDEIAIPNGMPAISFEDDDGVLVVVMRKDIFANTKMYEEALEHEIYENRYWQQAKDYAITQIASQIAAQDYTPETTDYVNLKNKIIRSIVVYINSEETDATQLNFPNINNESYLLATLKMDPERVVCRETLRLAHIITNCQCIINNFDGINLMQIHLQELSRMTPPIAELLLQDDRQYQLNIYKHFFPTKIEIILAYEKLFRERLEAIKNKVVTVVPSGQSNYSDDAMPVDIKSAANTWALGQKWLRRINNNQSRWERGLAGGTGEVVAVYPVATRDGYVLNHVVRELAKSGGEEYDYGDKARRLINALFLEPNMDISTLSGDAIIRLFEQLKLLPAEIQVLPGRSAYNYKRMGKDNRVELSDTFRKAYEKEIVAHKDDIVWFKEHSRKKIKGRYAHDAIILDEMDGFSIPDGLPSVSFFSDKKLIIVLRKGLPKDILEGDKISAWEEAVRHELLEDYWYNFLLVNINNSDLDMQDNLPQKALRIAHVLASAEMIKLYGNGKLLPLHQLDIAMMEKDYAAGLVGEYRSPQHGWVGTYLGPEILAAVEIYDTQVVEPALAARSKDVGGINIFAQNVRVTGKCADFNLSPEILQELQRASGMDFVVETVIPAR